MKLHSGTMYCDIAKRMHKLFVQPNMIERSNVVVAHPDGGAIG